jgi:hypothetical protein
MGQVCKMSEPARVNVFPVNFLLLPKASVSPLQKFTTEITEGTEFFRIKAHWELLW